MYTAAATVVRVGGVAFCDHRAEVVRAPELSFVELFSDFIRKDSVFKSMVKGRSSPELQIVLKANVVLKHHVRTIECNFLWCEPTPARVDNKK